MAIIQRTRIDQIKEQMDSFMEQRFDSELKEKAVALLHCVQKNHHLNFFKGKTETWAAAVLYVTARFNLLFDHSQPAHCTPQEIVAHFGQLEKSLRNKAQDIETYCKLTLGDTHYCTQAIGQKLNFFQTKSGFIIPKLVLDETVRNIKTLDPAEARWLEIKIQEKVNREKKKLLERLKHRSAKKVADKKQLSLFK